MYDWGYASLKENVAGDRRHGETDRMTSRYTRRWDTAPSPRRILDDSALEVDHPQQRSGKHRVEKDKVSPFALASLA